MGRPYKVTWFYQSDEEILQTACWYWDPANDDVAPEDLATLTAETVTAISTHFQGTIAAGIISWAVECKTPAINGKGPSRWINAHSELMSGPTPEAVMDSIVVNTVLAGENSQGKAVRGGFRMSVIPQGSVENNNIKAVFQTDFQLAMELVFPQTRATGSSTVHRAIRSVRPPLEPEFVYPTTIRVQPKVGINLTRVGNRPQSNAGPRPE